MGGNYLNTECYDEGSQTLTVWLVEEHDGADVIGITGIYGDEDWACANADRNAEDGEIATRVREATFDLTSSKIVYQSGRPG